MSFQPVLSTHTNPAPSGFLPDRQRSSAVGGVRPDNDSALILALRDAVSAAQASYDATRSHKALTRLQDAKHALLAAEVGL